MPAEPEDIAKTVIRTPLGLLYNLRMPFGLRNAIQTFQQFISEAVQGMLIFGTVPKQHEELLKELFTRLQKYGLVIDAKKCTSGTSELEFLGHHVSTEGIRTLK